MKKSLFVAVGVVALVALGMAIQASLTVFIPDQERNASDVGQNPAVAPESAPAQKPSSAIKQKSGQGPWQRDLNMSTASGMASLGERVTTFEERSGVPTVTLGADGTLYAAFQWFPENDDANFDKVAIKTSSDNGTTWSDPQPITMSGLPNGYQRPFDPTLVTLADGRLRLYFTSSPERQGPGASRQIYAAISSDGINYTYEGLSLSLTTDQAYDSGVALLNAVWHMLTPGGEEFVGANHATSVDGVAFTLVDPLRHSGIDGKNQNWTGNLFAGNAGIGFVGGGAPMWYTTTSDGTNWSTPNNFSISGGDPAIARASDGTYVLIFVSDPVR